jgi:hypothetical protein
MKQAKSFNKAYWTKSKKPACRTTVNKEIFCSACQFLWNLQTSGPYRSADKSLARPGRKQATATEDFDVHISYL